MSEYHHLIGADDVINGGKRMQDAAEEMTRAVSNLDDVFHRQRMFMDDWLNRFQTTMIELPDTLRLAIAPAMKEGK